MNIKELQIFIDAALHYFDISLGKGEIRIGEPRLSSTENSAIYEYTGLINISGERSGQVYFSSPLDFIRHVLTAIGEDDVDDELVADLVGEIANSIAGSAQSHFGNGFCLSVPTILRDSEKASEISSAYPSYVIPLIWRDNTSNISVWFK